MVTLLVTAGSASAAPATVTRTGYINDFINTCNDEMVHVEGTYQEVLHTNADGSMSGQVTVRGTAEGDMGNTYMFSENTRSAFNPDESATAQDEFRLISQGSAPNRIAFINLTLFPNGEYELTTIKASCPA